MIVFGINLLFLLGVPLILTRLHRYYFPNISPLILSYTFGVVLSVFTTSAWQSPYIEQVMQGAMVFSLPLLLLSSRPKIWKRLGKPMAFSFLLAILSVLIVNTTLFFCFPQYQEITQKALPLLTGLFIGGTPNMASLGLALNLDTNFFVQMNTLDIFWSIFYLIILFSFLPKLLLRFLPHTHKPEKKALGDIRRDKQRRRKRDFIIPFLISIAIIVVSFGATYLFCQEINTIVVLLLLSSLTLVTSIYIDKQKVQASFELGEYFLYVFALGMGWMTNFSLFFRDLDVLSLVFAAALFGASLLHFLLAYIFKLERDIALVTQVASILGPPFIAPIALKIKNRAILTPGLVVAILGLTLGNYLGILIFRLLN